MASMAGLKLRKARESRQPSVSQYKLAASLGLKRSRIASYEGQVAEPPAGIIEQISKMWDIPVEWFWDGQDTPVPSARPQEALADGAFVPVHPDDQTFAEEDFASNEYVTLPTWEGTIAGFKHEWHFDDGKTAPPTEVPKYMLSRKRKERFIVCKPKGASMAPRIQQGDVVLVRFESNPAPGEIIVARNESGQNFIKVYRIGGTPGDEVPELHSINGNFPVIGMDEEWTCKGVVVGIRKPYITEGLNEEFRNGSPLRA